MATLLTTGTTSRSANGMNLADDVAADAAGNYFVNTGVELIYIFNGDSASTVLTAVTQKTVDGLAVTDLTATIAAGERRVLGPFPTDVYNDASNYCQLTFSSVTSLTVLAFKSGTVNV